MPISNAPSAFGCRHVDIERKHIELYRYIDVYIDKSGNINTKTKPLNILDINYDLYLIMPKKESVICAKKILGITSLEN